MAAVTQADFARAVLSGIGAPLTQDNIDAMVGWENAEGGNWQNDAAYNPLNTTQDESGAGSINSVGVKAYRSWQQGIEATVATLTNGSYGSILSAFKAGNNPGAVASAIGSSPWGTSASAVQSTIAAATGTHFATSPIPDNSSASGGDTGTGSSSSSGSSSNLTAGLGGFLLKATLTLAFVGGGMVLSGVGLKGALSS